MEYWAQCLECPWETPISADDWLVTNELRLHLARAGHSKHVKFTQRWGGPCDDECLCPRDDKLGGPS